MKRIRRLTRTVLLVLFSIQAMAQAEDAPRAPRSVRRAARRAERAAEVRPVVARGLSDGLASAGRHAPLTPRLAARVTAKLRQGVFPVMSEPDPVAISGNIIQSEEYLPPLPPRNAGDQSASSLRTGMKPDVTTDLPACRPIITSVGRNEGRFDVFTDEPVHGPLYGITPDVAAVAPASGPVLQDASAAVDVLSRVVVASELAGLVLPEPGRLDPGILQASSNQLPVAAGGAIVFAQEAPPPLPPREQPGDTERAAEPGDGFVLTLDQIKSARGYEEEARIQAALERPVSLHFTEARLSEIFRHVANSQGINLVVDDTGLSEEGVSHHDRVTISVDGVTLKSALGLILDSRNLVCQVEDEVLKITSRGRSDGELIAQVYSVADLIRPASQIGATAPEGGETLPGPAAVADFENVVELICSTIQPESWNELGGPAAVVPHPASRSVVIRQTRRGHREIASLLDGIRRLMNDVRLACEIEPESIPEDVIRIPVTPRIIIQEDEEELLGIPLDPSSGGTDSDKHSLQPALPPGTLPGTFDVFGIQTHDLLFREEDSEQRLILQTP